MSEKTDKQIVSEIEIHTDNALKILKRAYEIQKLALDLNNIDAYITLIKRAIALQELSTQEIQKAVALQNIYSERLNSLQYLRTKLGLF